NITLPSVVVITYENPLMESVIAKIFTTKLQSKFIDQTPPEVYYKHNPPPSKDGKHVFIVDEIPSGRAENRYSNFQVAMRGNNVKVEKLPNTTLVIIEPVGTKLSFDVFYVYIHLNSTSKISELYLREIVNIKYFKFDILSYADRIVK